MIHCDTLYGRINIKANVSVQKLGDVLLCNWHLLDGLTHVQTHFHTVLGVVGQRLWQAGYTVITVAQDFDPHTFIFLRSGTKIQQEVRERP